MSMFTKRWAFVYAALIFMLLAAPHCADAMRFEYSAGEEGFHCTYLIPFFGFGRVKLAGPDVAAKNIHVRLLFVKLATIQLSVASVNPDAQPPNLMLHYDITSRFSSSSISGNLPVSFGDGGIRIKLFRKWLLWTKGNDADIRLLLTRKKTKVVCDFDMPALNGTWKDEASPENNHIQQSIAYDNNTFADIDLTITYLRALVTRVNYSITVTPDPVGAPDNSSSFDGDLVLPNGSYHAWFNAAQ